VTSELSGKRILLTGGGGFLGTHLCERFVEQNRITVYDNGSRDALRYTTLEQHPNLTLVRGDVLDKARLLEAARGAEVIVHMAAVAGVSNYRACRTTTPARSTPCRPT
jgi:UDP-glucose 4-epimerase